MGPSRSSRRSTCSSTWTFLPSRSSVTEGGPAAPGPSAGRGSRALGNRGVLVSSASTVLFFATIAVVVVLAPGSGVVAERFFSPQHLWQSLVGSAGLPSVLGAFWLNVQIFMVSEVSRAGIESVHESQNAAARSLGLTRWQSLRFVVLPQAIRRVIPPLLNDFIGLQKDTALVSVLGSIEAARA